MLSATDLQQLMDILNLQTTPFPQVQKKFTETFPPERHASIAVALRLIVDQVITKGDPACTADGLLSIYLMSVITEDHEKTTTVLKRAVKLSLYQCLQRVEVALREAAKTLEMAKYKSGAATKGSGSGKIHGRECRAKDITRALHLLKHFLFLCILPGGLSNEPNPHYFQTAASVAAIPQAELDARVEGWSSTSKSTLTEAVQSAKAIADAEGQSSLRGLAALSVRNPIDNPEDAAGDTSVVNWLPLLMYGEALENGEGNQGDYDTTSYVGYSEVYNTIAPPFARPDPTTTLAGLVHPSEFHTLPCPQFSQLVTFDNRPHIAGWREATRLLQTAQKQALSGTDQQQLLAATTNKSLVNVLGIGTEAFLAISEKNPTIASSILSNSAKPELFIETLLSASNLVTVNASSILVGAGKLFHVQYLSPFALQMCTALRKLGKGSDEFDSQLQQFAVTLHQLIQKLGVKLGTEELTVVKPLFEENKHLSDVATLWGEILK